MMGAKDFWEAHWDKIISVLVSGLIALLVGYFSGVLAVQSDLTKIRERLARVETKVNTNLEPKVATIQQHSLKFVVLEEELKRIKHLNDVAAQTNLLLSRLIEQQQGATVSDLKELLGRN